MIKISDRRIPDIPNIYQDNQVSWIVTNSHSPDSVQIRKVASVVFTPLVTPLR